MLILRRVINADRLRNTRIVISLEQQNAERK